MPIKSAHGFHVSKKQIGRPKLEPLPISDAALERKRAQSESRKRVLERMKRRKRGA